MAVRSTMSATYKVHEFAELSGVTVKTLHRYDRLGLLKLRRTETGHRIYAERDLERLQQVVALKDLGLSLQALGTRYMDLMKRGAHRFRDMVNLLREPEFSRCK